MRRIWIIALLLAAIGTAPAMARPRDDVLTVAFRCGGIADTRAWLDCYYGAAQPIRAALGLPSVPPTQVHLAAAPPAGGVPQDSAVRDAVMGDAARCYVRGDDRAWLNCYYAAVQPVRALLRLSPAPQAANAPAPTRTDMTLAEPPRGSWLAGAHHGEAARMASYRYNSQGQFTVALDNGQVWRQMPGDVKKARWTRPAGEYAVVITHGALGSINFSVSGQPFLFKVEQVR